MHILLTNDDGPPNAQTSPYISTFIRVLTSAPFNHTVSVVLPTTQRSWIGKAHLLPPSHYPGGDKTRSKNEDVTDNIKPVYYDPATSEVYDSLAKLRQAQAINGSKKENGVTNGESASKQPSYYVLIPGTPSTCVQLGLFHHNLLFPDFAQPTTSTSDATSSPIDLILSGPNFGRNTTAAFALSSGTIGGALEGAVCGIRSIAISFAFFTRQESEETVRDASTLGCQIVERLVADWAGKKTLSGASAASGQSAGDDEKDSTPDLYTLNIPLVEDVLSRPVYWTWMLGNKWSTGSLYQSIAPSAKEEEPFTDPGDVKGTNGDDLRARSGATPNGVSSSSNSTKQDQDEYGTPPQFRWQPTFSDVWSTVEKSKEGNDGRVIREKCTSVTPLKAGFSGLYGSGGGRWTGRLRL